MPYKHIIYVRLEKRLLNDHRWFMMTDNAQLLYIKLILLAAETYNKIPKNYIPKGQNDVLKSQFDNVLYEALRSKLEPGVFIEALKEVKQNFPKFKSNKHFYYFKEFETKTNYIPKEKPLGNPKEIPNIAYSIEEKRIIKNSIVIPPTIEEVINYCKERNKGVDPNKFYNHYQAKGWLIGRNKMKDWKAAVRTWEQTKNFIPFELKKKPARLQVLEMIALKIDKETIKTSLLADGYSEVEIDEALGKT